MIFEVCCDFRVGLDLNKCVEGYLFLFCDGMDGEWVVEVECKVVCSY